MPEFPAPTLPRALPWLGLATLATLALLAVAVMWPALGAGFLQDDWDFLASATHLSSPLPYFIENYSRGYFHRPNGMLAWWLLTQAFGLAALGHYAVQIVVHVACAMALLWLVRGLGASRAAAYTAAALFTVHPGMVATSLWLSNRFDLLATLGLLLCLRQVVAADLGRTSALVAIALLGWLAVGAKESGLLVLPLAALALWLRPEVAGRLRLRAFAAVLLPVAAWFTMRLLVHGPDDVTGQRNFEALAGQAISGISLWVNYLPQALGLDAAPWMGWIATGGLLGIGLIGVSEGRRHPVARRAWLGLAMLLLPPLIQWPVVHAALAMPDALAISVSLRFYFLALCGAALLLSAGLDALLPARLSRVPMGWIAIVAVALLVVPLAMDSHRRARAWTADTANPGALRMEAALASRFAAQASGAGCKLVFSGALGPNLPGFADHIAKAHLPRGHRALDSLVVTDPMPWSAIVGPAGATPEALAPLANRWTGPVELTPSPVGPIFYVSLDYDDRVRSAPSPCTPVSLQWNGDDFVPAAPASPPPSSASSSTE
jgi:hypothetical protein